MSDGARGRGGLRREVSILLPVAFLLVVLLSVFTLFSYRNGVGLLADERRGEAVALAEGAAARLAERRADAPAAGFPRGLELRALAPAARAVAVLDADGTVLARGGDLAPERVMPPALEPPAAALAIGPDDTVGPTIVAFAPLPPTDRPGASGAGETRWVRVDLPASALALQLRGLAVLSWVVLGIDAALVVLVLLFLGRLLKPYERLLERARTAGEVPPGAEDEVAFLVATFERALDALARPEPSEADDIALLQRTLAGSFDSGVLLLDARGDVLAVNPAGAALLEAEPVDVDGEGADAVSGRAPAPLERVLAGHPALVALLSEAVAEERGVRRRELETTTPSGRPLALGLTVHPLRRDGEGPRGFLVLFVDLTEVRRQSEQARLADSLRQIGELAAGVAHELRNSLATLKGYLSLIDRDSRQGRMGRDAEAEAAPLADYVAEMRRETDHLQRVLEDFLSFARPGTVRLEAVDLYRVLARAAADPVLADADVRLDLPGPDPGPGPEAGAGALPLSGDPQLLERAFRNLLHNAAQASRETVAGPVVEVSAAAASDGELEVTVADRGPGLPPEVRERLFQPFASGRPGGVGLGLALARRIVVLHGGRLELADREGGGTVARVSLPAGAAGTNVTEGNNPPPDEPPAEGTIRGRRDRQA